MVYQDDDTIMIGGVLLPGLYKKVEVKTAAKIDEQEVEGSSAKPKQATGYEDAQISIELELHDSEAQTKEDKLAVIQNLFRMQAEYHGHPGSSERKLSPALHVLPFQEVHTDA